MNPPFVTVIIPVKDERSYVRECVLSLARQSYPVDNFRIIVVIDLLGNDHIKSDLETLGIKYLSVVKNRNRGPAAARNLGVSLADKRTEFFAFTDADCIIDQNWLLVLVDAVASLPEEIGCVGGVNLVPKDDPVISRLLGFLEQTLIGGGWSAQGSFSSAIRDVRSIPNCNALYRAKWWVENKQDESLIVGQDGEFNYRLEKSGCRFAVIPNAIVWHHRPTNIRKHTRRMWKYGAVTGLIFKKEPGILAVRWYAVPPILLLFGSIILAILGAWWPFAWILLGMGLALYTTAILFTTLEVVFYSRMWQSALVPLLLLIQHFIYSFGFIRGFLSGARK
jgi:glycosyltransferase involved in cell wall biosynthesis